MELMARLALAAAALLAVAVVAAAAAAGSRGLRDAQMQDAIADFRRQHEAAVAAAAPDPFNCTMTALLFDQPLDHFSPRDARTWRQRWYVCDGFYARGSKQPIYFFLGGEGPRDGPFYSVCMDMAREQGGLLVFAEHRYYGQSLPLGNASFTNEGLQWLTAEQALADFAALATAVKQQYGAPPGALTLAYGGSYAGSLAVYARQLHPHVFGAAYASSAVVKMVLPTPSYQAVRPDSWAAMSAALREAGGARCAAFAGAAFDGLQFLEGSAAGRQQLAVAVSMCSAADLASVGAVQGIAQWLREAWWVTFQTQFKTVDPNNWMAQACRAIPFYPATPLGAVQWLSNFTRQHLFDGSPCFAAEATVLPYTAGSPRPTDPGDLAWDWQCCRQGFPNDPMFDSCPPQSLFGRYRFSLPALAAYCRRAFGLPASELLAPPRWMRFDPQAYSRVGRIVFASSAYDPWRPGSVLRSLARSVPALTTPRASHCSDLYQARAATPPQINATQAHIKAIVARWALEYGAGSW